MNQSSFPSPGHQNGMALLVCLILLLLLTMIGVSSMQSATLQEKMTGSVMLRNTSFQNAEAALRIGESTIQASGFTLAACVYCLPPPESSAVSAAGVYVGSSSSGGTWVSTGTGWYMIQNLGVTKAAVNLPNASATLYRVTAVSVQGTLRTVVESIYAQYTQ